jgi:hypothetical protein
MMALCSSAELVGPILLCRHLPHSCPPFATRVLAGDGGFAIRFSLYALIQVITGLSFLLMTRQLARHQLLRHDTPAPIIDDSVLHSSVTTTMFLYRFPSPLPRPGHTHAGSSYRRPPGFCALPDRLLDRVIGSAQGPVQISLRRGADRNARHSLQPPHWYLSFHPRPASWLHCSLHTRADGFTERRLVVTQPDLNLRLARLGVQSCSLLFCGGCAVNGVSGWRGLPGQRPRDL